MNSYKQDVNAIKQIQILTSLFKNNPRMTSELLVNSAFPWSYIAGGNISIFFLINFRGSFTLRNRFFCVCQVSLSIIFLKPLRYRFQT